MKKRKVSVSMKDVVLKRRVLVSITAGVVALLVVSLIVGSFVVYPVQGAPNPTGATETSGCTTPLAPREKKLYVLASQLKPEGPLYVSAVDTNGRQSWMQQFTTFSPNKASLEVRSGIIYAFATIQSTLNIVTAYDANSGKKLWNIQVSANYSGSGMSVCNNIVYLWTSNTIYAYNAKTGSSLRQTNATFADLPPSTRLISVPMFTDNAIVFAGIDQGGVSDHDTVYAFDSKKGTPLWKVNIPNQHLNKHFLGLSLTATNKAVYVSQFNQDSPQVVEAFSISDGKSLWKASVSMKGGNHFDCLITCNLLSASTLVTNNILYLSPGTDSDAHVVVALNVSHGTYLWEDSKVNNFGPLQDRLYISHVNMSDFCQVDPITGRSQWCNSSKSYGNNPGERATSDQTTVYIPSLDGIHALQKNNGKLKWIYKGNTSGTALMVAYGLSFDY